MKRKIEIGDRVCFAGVVSEVGRAGHFNIVVQHETHGVSCFSSGSLSRLKPRKEKPRKVSITKAQLAKAWDAASKSMSSPWNVDSLARALGLE